MWCMDIDKSLGAKEKFCCRLLQVDFESENYAIVIIVNYADQNASLARIVEWGVYLFLLMAFIYISLFIALEQTDCACM